MLSVVHELGATPASLLISIGGFHQGTQRHPLLPSTWVLPRAYIWVVWRMAGVYTGVEEELDENAIQRRAELP